jgi:hypothetical protein
MSSAQYDIFRKHEAELVWIEASLDLSSAKKRIRELAEKSGEQFVVYGPAGETDSRKLRIKSEQDVLHSDFLIG